ncbi:hypothetical protein H2199_001090 [Coniosporium tulheliwenetii]|uniref:Uncharacterized protein n=1 Tax=Coniosporium tulheliwenetii TaxID=3383036 RepID=A0ACC2ZL46_9PEZI|nr:hypothetical protein H2199_001090 [Cladosporium sp. JES 115]
MVALFARSDESGNRIEHMVVKESIPPWRDPIAWKNGEPAEAVLHRRVHDRSPYIVGYKGCRVFPEARRIRLYVEYAPYQALADVIHDYNHYERYEIKQLKKRREEERREKQDNGEVIDYEEYEEIPDENEDEGNQRFPIPEPFMWYVFEAMASALLVLHEGGAEVPVPKWTPILHLDLKPDNIFLALLDPDRFRPYPQPKLGDFGLAVELFNNDSGNPLDFQHRGTKDFMPPEQKAWSIPRPPIFAKVSEAADVFALGATMMCMIRKSDDPVATTRDPRREVHQRGDKDKVSTLLVNIKSDHPWHALAALVRPCLEYDPADRPKLRQLRDTIRAHIQAAAMDVWDDLPQDFMSRQVEFPNKLLFDVHPDLHPRSESDGSAH